ncbi:MAG: J domain-containing protein [Pyrinomonadaceae bacterium]
MYYELLGVAPGTSGRELKEAYRDLAKVWHPDRFSHDPRLQRKAQEKLKEINEAYERLTSGDAARPPRTPSAPGAPHAHADAAARRGRTRPVLLTAAVFCAVFLAALGSLVPRDARPAPEQTPPAEGHEAPPPDKEQQPDGGARMAAAHPARGKERAGGRPAAEATSGDESVPATSVQQLRPMPTVTVTIDAATGMLATRDCPSRSTLTYPAGDEPRRHCTAQHKTKVDESRLKSIGKRLATPFKRRGGGSGTEAVERQDAQPPGGDRSNNR